MSTNKNKQPSIYNCSKKEYLAVKSIVSKTYKQRIMEITTILNFIKTHFKGVQFLQCFVDLKVYELNERFLKSKMKMEDLWESRIEKDKTRVFLQYPNGKPIPIVRFSINKVLRVFEYVYARKTTLTDDNYKKIKKHLIKAYKDQVGSIDFMLKSIKSSKIGLKLLNMFKAYSLNPIFEQNILSVMLPEEKYLTHKYDFVDGTHKITNTYNANGRLVLKQYFSIDEVLNCIQRYYEQLPVFY